MAGLQLGDALSGDVDPHDVELRGKGVSEGESDVAEADDADALAAIEEVLVRGAGHGGFAVTAGSADMIFADKRRGAEEGRRD
jgi:hypothetical protein